MDRGLHLQVSEEGADAEQLARLTGYLRQELLQLDVENVTAPHSVELPSGTRGDGATTAGALMVALGQSAEGLRSVLSVIKDWLGRGHGTGRAVRMELDGDVLELSRATSVDQDRLVKLFIDHHTR